MPYPDPLVLHLMTACTQDPEKMDILLQFRIYRITMAADKEKAFLMVSLWEQNRDVLCFLWVKDPRKEVPDVTVLRFTRVVFGVSASPFSSMPPSNIK